jgi:outer membrane immunogenic protein
LQFLAEFGGMATRMPYSVAAANRLTKLGASQQKEQQMFRTDRLATLVVGGVLAILPAAAQEANKSEVSVQAFGSFVKTTTSNGVQQSDTNSGGILANYRFFFTGNQGVEVNYGYSRNTQSYGLVSGPLDTKTDQHEFTAAYVYRRRYHSVTPFVEAGAGAIVFDPTNAFTGSTQARATFVYGGGVDLNLTQKFFLRAEYRGFVYNSPTFDLAAASGDDRVTHRAEPSVGFGYRF